MSFFEVSKLSGSAPRVVLAGLVPAIHALTAYPRPFAAFVDARTKSGQDDL